MQEFAEKTAVITGGASGIGLALANRFADARMNVVLADIEADALERAVGHFEERQTPVLGVVTDTMRRESIAALLDQTVERFGAVHILCNNAGVAAHSEARPIWDVTQEDWDWVLGVNLHGVIYGLQVFVPHMLEHGEPGHIVNTASLAGLLPGGGPYGVSKHGVLSLTERLYRDLEAANAKIGASVLCPGFVNTQINKSERNRPGGESAEATQEVQFLMAQVLEGGKNPAEVADLVFESIREERCYILPHAGWDDVVGNRVQAVLERGAPLSVDMMELMARRAAGQDI